MFLRFWIDILDDLDDIFGWFGWFVDSPIKGLTPGCRRPLLKGDAFCDFWALGKLVWRVPGSLWQPLRSAVGETYHEAVSKCYRNNVLGSWQAVLGLGNALKLQRDITRAGERTTRQFRNAIETMFWGAGRQFWDLATHWSCSETLQGPVNVPRGSFEML